MTTTLAITIPIALGVLSLAVLLAFVRLVLGPTLPDRVLALDLMTVAGIGIMALAGIAFDTEIFLDVALIMMVAGFIGTAAFARFVEQQARRRREGGQP
jgi:multicomponent Na+:H+ antiporter subunit F